MADVDWRRWHDASQAHFARVAPDYDRGRAFEQGAFWAREIAAHVTLAPADRVLDAGCGTGLFAAAFVETLGCAIVGLDPSAAMLAAAQAKTRRVGWTRGQSEALCFADASFQAIFLSQVWHHLADGAQAAREFYRVLKPGGALFIKTFSHAQLRTRWDLVQVFPELLPFMLGIYPDSSDFELLLRGLGFAAVQQIGYRKDDTLRPSELLQIAEGQLWSMFAYLSEAGRQRGITYLRDRVRTTGDAPVPYPEFHLLVCAHK